MKNAKAKYIFLGQDLIRVKNLLAMDPYGKQADKRKKEAADYESRVCPILLCGVWNQYCV